MSSMWHTRHKRMIIKELTGAAALSNFFRLGSEATILNLMHVDARHEL